MEQLGLFKTPREDIRVNKLISFLRDRDWMTRKQLTQTFDWNDREIRSIVEASAGEIISGQKGYKLTMQATKEEFEDSCRQLRSQIRTNTSRLIDQERIFHRGNRNQDDLFKKPNHYDNGL